MTIHPPSYERRLTEARNELAHRLSRSGQISRDSANKFVNDALQVRHVVDQLPALLGTRYSDERVSITDSRVDPYVLSLWHQMVEWSGQPIVLQQPHGSSYHKLEEAHRDGTHFLVFDSPTPFKAYFHKPPQGIFVVEHDWAAAFKGATDFDQGDWTLPFPECVFEFQLTGHRVIVRVVEMKWSNMAPYLPESDAFNATMKRELVDKGIDLERIPMCGMFVQMDKDLWLGDSGFIPGMPGTGRDIPFRHFIDAQIRALSIALEAEVATAEVTRAPLKLNESRARSGKVPLADFHTVVLSNRRRAEPLRALESDRRRPRLHFRRGHWRHFTDHRTWIKWMLVGNPDLGFIDKDYRA